MQQPKSSKVRNIFGSFACDLHNTHTHDKVFGNTEKQEAAKEQMRIGSQK